MITHEQYGVDSLAQVQVVFPGVPGPPPNSAYGRSQVLVRNTSESTTVYIGEFNVSPATGMPLLPGEIFNLSPFGPNDELWAITAAGSVDIRVLRVDF